MAVQIDPKPSLRCLNQTGDSVYRDELFIFFGGEEIGNPSTGVVTEDYNTKWVAEFRNDLTIKVYKQIGSELIEQTEDLPSFPEFGGTESNFSFALDQNQRIVYSYQDNGTIKVTRFSSGSYVQDISFTGIRPVILNEALTARYVSGSDIIIFYQKTDDESKIYSRIQSENYGTERELVDYGQDIILDFAMAWNENDALRYALLVADQYGEKIYITDLLSGYVSELYPYHKGEVKVAVSLDVTPSFIYNKIVERYEGLILETVKVSHDVGSFTYNFNVHVYENLSILTGMSHDIAEFVYQTVAVKYNGLELGGVNISYDIAEFIYETVAFKYYHPEFKVEVSHDVGSFVYETV